MKVALDGVEVQKFPEPVYMNKSSLQPTPTVEPSTAEPTPTPAETPPTSRPNRPSRHVRRLPPVGDPDPVGVIQHGQWERQRQWQQPHADHPAAAGAAQ